MIYNDEWIRTCNNTRTMAEKRRAACPVPVVLTQAIHPLLFCFLHIQYLCLLAAFVETSSSNRNQTAQREMSEFLSQQQLFQNSCSRAWIVCRPLTFFIRLEGGDAGPRTKRRWTSASFLPLVSDLCILCHILTRLLESSVMACVGGTFTVTRNLGIGFTVPYASQWH